jgi:hypothetical protein
MAVNFAGTLYLTAFDIFARPVTILPLASQPGVPAYAARGIYDTGPADVEAQDDSIFSDQKTILDILEAEFPVLPAQLDRITIPADVNAGPALGEFEVTDANSNGGGETTLALRKIVTSKPS